MSICIHHHHICDGIVHCRLFEDDELLCSDMTCPTRCVCHGFSISCANSGIVFFPKISFKTKVKMLNLGGNFITIGSANLTEMTSLLFLNISNMNLTTVRTSGGHLFANLESLKIIDLQSNLLSFVNARCFQGLGAVIDFRIFNNSITAFDHFAFSGLLVLSVLNLSSQALTKLDNKAFIDLDSLRMLDLSFNMIRYVSKLGFFGLTGLVSLFLQGNSFYVNHGLISALRTLPVSLKNLEVSDISICCLIEHICDVLEYFSEANSCTRLISIEIIPYFLWCYITFGTVLNMVSLFFSLKSSKKEDKGKREFVQYIHLIDLCFVMYLVIIIIAHHTYGQQFQPFSNNWTETNYCYIASFLSLFSLIASETTSLFIAIHRLHVIVSLFQKDWVLKLLRISLGCMILLVALCTSGMLFPKTERYDDFCIILYYKYINKVIAVTFISISLYVPSTTLLVLFGINIVTIFELQKADHKSKDLQSSKNDNKKTSVYFKASIRVV